MMEPRRLGFGHAGVDRVLVEVVEGPPQVFHQQAAQVSADAVAH
jgi:hypothetical protein